MLAIMGALLIHTLFTSIPTSTLSLEASHPTIRSPPYIEFQTPEDIKNTAAEITKQLINPIYSLIILFKNKSTKILFHFSHHFDPYTNMN